MKVETNLFTVKQGTVESRKSSKFYQRRMEMKMKQNSRHNTITWIIYKTA